MSRRADFTLALAALLQYMANEGDTPIVDYVKRSDEEQARLFKAGLSKCDGKVKVSAHQHGEAADIYLMNPDGTLHDWGVDDRSDEYHSFWRESGGLPVISWDVGHFEWGRK